MSGYKEKALLNMPAPPPPRPAGVSENHDEAKAGSYTLPDPLTMKNGQKVTTPEMWWTQRRPEIYDAMMSEVYGKIPANTPKVTWRVASVTDNGTAKIKEVVGTVDNSSYPAITVAIRMTVYTPSKAAGPVPMIVEAAVGGPAAPSLPTSAEVKTLNQALKAALEKQDPATQDIFAKHPGYRLLADAPAPPLPPAGGLQQVLAKGWGFTSFNTGSVQPDSDAGVRQGIIGLMNKGELRQRPDEWGVLAAWSWGLSKSVDYFETDKDVDAKQLGVEGFSRWGKTAVLAAAVEPRWALSWAGDSGEGGTKIHRRDYGETVDDVALNFGYWMAGNFQKYTNHKWNDLPVDAHELVALVAPRPVFITGGTTDQHADAQGMFETAVGASPVYQLLGAPGLETAAMPAADVSLIKGNLGYRMHTGAHTPVPDWPVFIEFAGKYFHAPAAP